jgi:O-antigen ligase
MTRIGDSAPKRASGPLLALLVVTVASLVGIAIGMGTEKLVYLVVLAAIPLALKWPVEVALGSVALIFPFDSILVAIRSGSETYTVTWFVSVVAGVLLLARIMSGMRQSPPMAARLLILLVVWETTTTLWAADSTVALKRLPMAWSLLVLYLVAVSSRITKKQVRAIVAMTLVGGLAAAVWASWAYFSGISWSGTGRASLMLQANEADPNYFAAMLLIPLSLAFGMFGSTRSRLLKMLTVLTMALAVLAIFLTMSRGGLVALIVLSGVYVYRFGIRLRTVAAIVVVLAAAVLFAPPTLWKRLQPEALSTGAGRTNIWVGGVQMVKHHFLLGVGLANFPVAYDSYAGAGSIFQGYRRDSHNTYLNILAEQGVVGLALFLAALFYQFRLLRSAMRRSRPPSILLVSIEAALLAVLGAACFLDLLFSKFVWFLLILGTLIARTEWNHEAPSSQNPPAGQKLASIETVVRDPMFTF